MKSMLWTSAPAGFSGAGSAGLRPFGVALPSTVLPGCASARLRAPEAFTSPCRGTGLPFGGQVADGAVLRSAAFGRARAVVVTGEHVATEPAQQDYTTHDSATTLGIHSTRRPPS